MIARLRHRLGRRMRLALIARAAHEESACDLLLWEDEMAVDHA